MDKLAAQYVLDIIRAEMKLAEEQTILRDQNFEFPNDRKLYVVAGLIRGAVLSAQSSMGSTADANVQQENQTVQMREEIQIDIAGRGNEAIYRNWEIVAALNSFLSKRTQEKANFKIFRIPKEMQNTSSAEGPAQLNRYTLTFVCNSWYRKSSPMASGDYYDDFTTRLDDENTIGTGTPLAEFEINQGGIVP